jgi:hypothetical protein
VLVFLERYVLAVTAALTVLMVATNPMGFDWKQRISGGLALVLFAYFVGHTVYKASREVKTSVVDQQTIVTPNSARAPEKSAQSPHEQHAGEDSMKSVAAPSDSIQRLRGSDGIRPLREDQQIDNSQVTAIKNPRILFASALWKGSRDPHEFGPREIGAVTASFPRSAVQIEKHVGENRLRQLLTTSSFDIVLLGALVQRDGTVILDLDSGRPATNHGLPGEGLVKLLEVANVKLLILGSCDSVPLAAKLSNRNMVAATGNLYIDYFQNWLETFFRMLAAGRPLANAFTIADDSVRSRGGSMSRMSLIEVRTGRPLTFAS